jgi:hypothetical protein
MKPHTMNQDTHAGFNYTRDTGVQPEIYFYDAPPGAQARPPGDDPHQMAVHDGRSRAASFSLDTEGFALREIESSFERWDDDAAIRDSFYDQVVAFVKRSVGAQRVIVFDHTIRTKLNAAQQTAEHTTTQRAPVMLAHCDYTPLSGPLRVRQLLGAEGDELLKRRVAFYNFWMPLRRPVEEKPLAMCDVTSTQADDFLTLKMNYRDRIGEIYVLRHATKHHWWYFPRMTPGQVVLMKTYESETDGRARFVGHSAFDHPDTAADAPRRESIEIRTMAFF